MTGAQYANLVASYVSRRFGSRSLKVYREIRIGKSIIGKNRCIDIFCVCETSNKAFAIAALPMPGCIVYAGNGFSEGVLHMLRASPAAAYCLPPPDANSSTAETRELDHLLAVNFGWWDVLIDRKAAI